MDSGAGLLHRLTSYAPDRDWDVPVDDPRVRHDLVPNDLATVPPFTKGVRRTGSPSSRLPRELPDPGVSATAVLAGVPAPAQPLDAAQLGRVLFLGAGVVRTKPWHGRDFLFRASGSAGGRFPLEVYASTRGVAGVPDGVHWYDPRRARARPGRPRGRPATSRRSSSRACRGGRGGATPSAGGGTCTGTRARCCRSCSAAAASAGFAPRLRSLFPDAAVRELVGADGVHEYPVALLSFGDGEPAIGATGPATPGELPPVELPLCTAAQRAGERDELGAPWPAEPALSDVPPSDSLDVVVRRRGSQRLMDRSPDAAARAAGVADGRGDARHRRAALGRRPRRRRRGARASTGGPTCRRRCGPGTCATSWSGSAWTRRSRPTRRTSSSGPRRCRRSTTAATATPSSRPGWSRAGCTWRRTPWARARPG